MSAASSDIPRREERAPAGPCSTALLTRECALLHRALFSRPVADASISADYVAAMASHPVGPDDATVARIVAGHLNLNALEFYWRLRRGRNAITRRFEALAAICEGRAEYWNDFTSSGTGRGRALLKLARLPFRAAGLVLIGWWQSVRHGIRF